LKVLFAIILMLTSFVLKAQKQVVYLIPGQGSDERLYKNIVLDSVVEVRHIRYFTPDKGWSMSDFARELAKQIDTTQSFSIVGVSLGGMLATEMAEFLHPKKVVIISSAKNRKEFPFRYRFQKAIPIHKIVPAWTDKIGAQILQPFVEPDRAKEKETFKAMLHDKDPKFLKRTIHMILEWNRLDYNRKIIHIHGDNDHTIPARNVTCDFLVEGGSHMMVLTEGELISDILNYVLFEKK